MNICFKLSPIVKHIKPVAVEVSHQFSSNKKETISIEQAMEYCISHFVKKDQSSIDIDYRLDRVIFEDGSSCFCNWYLQKNNDKPYAVYIAVGPTREKTFIASKVIDDD